jgi:peptidoglycan/xylan/chitin deacetylase (PgdA/CDA1 family)
MIHLGVSIPHRKTGGWGVWLLVLCVWLEGCAGFGVGSPFWPSESYRSDDRVVHRLRTGETPEMLAEKYLGETRLAWMVEDANPKQNFQPGRFVVIPLVIANPGGITADGYQTVPILCYHRFAPSCSSPLCMPADVFEKQIRHLKMNGYRVISPQELIEFLDYRKPIPKKAVMISIDDGYRSAYTMAYPILRKYGFTATLFVYIDYVGISRKAITWEQLKELKRAGFTIGSHSVAHSDLTKPLENETPGKYLARLNKEIYRSKKIIDKKLNQDTIIFSYPFGRQNKKVASMVKQAGYKIAVTVDRGSNPFFMDPFLLKREQILKRDLGHFSSRLRTFHDFPLR